MGTLQTTIKLNDQFTNQLNKINKSIQNTANAMNRLNSSNASSVKSVNKSLSNQISQNNTIMKQLGSWATKLRNIATIYFGIRGAVEGINRAVKLSDRMTMTDAKFNLVAGGDKKLAGDLKEKTFAAAQRSTTDYLEFGKAVGKLGILAGDKFKNQDSIVRFVELMNKSFQISGADTSERNAAMLQITQAIASNRLQGDEFRSILENAPMVMDALTKSLGVGHDKLKKMAKQGEITADVLIKAMFDAGTKIEEMYKQLPMTWERHWAKIKNVGVLAFEPIHRQLEKLFNSEKFQAFVDGLCTAMIVLGNLGGKALEWLAIGFNKVVELGKQLSGVFMFLRDALISIAGAVALYGIALALANSKLILLTIWTGLVTAAKAIFAGVLLTVKFVLGLVTGAWKAVTTWTNIASVASAIWQFITLNAVWIIIAVLAILIFWFYKVSDGWADVAGKIVGWTYKICAYIYNFFSGVCQWLVNTWDWVASNIGIIFDNIGIWWNNLWIDARIGFYGFINDVLSKLSSLAQKIQPLAKLLDVDLSGMIGKAQASVTGKITNLQSQKKSYKSYTAKKPVNWNSVDPTAAYNYGYDKGSGWVNNISKGLGNIGSKLDDLTKVDLNGQKLNADALNGMNDKLGDVGTNTGNTANNTGDIAKNTGSSEDYSYLRNWAYNKGMGNSIGYNIKIEQNNKNNIGNNMDLNRVVDAVRDAIIEGIMTQAEGVR